MTKFSNALEAALMDPEVKFIFILGHQFSDVAGMVPLTGERFRVTDLKASNMNKDVKVTSSGCYSKKSEASWKTKIAGYNGLFTGKVKSIPATINLAKKAMSAAVNAPEKELPKEGN